MKKYKRIFKEDTELSKVKDILNMVLNGRHKKGAKLTFDISDISGPYIQKLCLKLEKLDITLISLLVIL